MEVVTYLMANYNNGEFIEDALRSLFDQTVPRWKCLVLDDCGTDDSLEVVGALPDDRVTLLTNEANLGYTACLKRLIEYAETDIVAILDPDDALFPEATDHLLRTYAEHPDCGLVYSRYAVYDRALEQCYEIGGSEVGERRTSLRDGFIGHIKSFRRSAYRRTAGYDESIRYAEDRDIVYKLEEVTTPVFIDEVLYKWRVVSSSQSQDPEKRAIGFASHRRARRLALARRGITGFEALFYRLFWVDSLLWHPRLSPQAQRRVGRYLDLMRRLDERWRIRTDGRLRRS